MLCHSSDRDAWHRLRETGVGASESPAVLGEHKWITREELYARKVGMLPSQDDSDPMFWGRLMEPVAIQAYNERLGGNATPHGTLLRSHEHPHLLATLDATEGDDRIVEIKVTGSRPWDSPPEQYRIQIVQQMLVTGLRKARLVVLRPHLSLAKFTISAMEVAWDAALADRITRETGSFWSEVEEGRLGKAAE